ncbi:hypothetical protein GALMADRAFT_1038218 [Galerina marginata CBS 339.88]|uniref:Uncharacterized protein n=1 Tax=Galerina marginata (strain CBS 339.88) TaxID=685588 RepID=A0A067SLP9_GALM3|nr:hypothetical protein GALMADRAFT_1038218 [Galerina marginata CBS 339.88]
MIIWVLNVRLAQENRTARSLLPIKPDKVNTDSQLSAVVFQMPDGPPFGPGFPPDYLQKTVIAYSIDSSMLSVLLFGIYSMVYFGTLYIYLTRRSSQNRIVLATITLLYLISALQIGVEWKLLILSLDGIPF